MTGLAAVPRRGIRNNNPGNIRTSNIYVWHGQTGADSDGYCIFDDPAYGLRAICILWVNYREYHHCVTITDYISRWAPSGDNPTQAYIDFMVTALNTGPLDTLDIHSHAVNILRAIVWFENGANPYPNTTFLRAQQMSHAR